MKIAMIAWEYPPQFSGGLGIHCQALVQEIVKQEVSVDFYLPSIDQAQFYIPEGMAMHLVKIDQLIPGYMDGKYEIWDSVNHVAAQILNDYEPEGVELIHAHDWMGVYTAMQIHERYGTPVIWTVHSTEYDRAAGMPPHPGILAIEQAALECAVHTIAVSERTKESLMTNYHADSSQISVIYNGIYPTAFQHLADRDYEKSDGYVLFLGRVTGQKGPDDFLNAARIILAERDMRFMIAGDGNLLGPLRRRARQWKIDQFVTFAGAVKGDQLLECYKNAKIYVLPSISEPFGITVLEAMASGIPSIITTTTGAGEIVKHVYRVEPSHPEQLAAAIVALMDDAKLQHTLGQAGAEEICQFSWNLIADQTRKLYTRLIENLQERSPDREL